MTRRGIMGAMQEWYETLEDACRGLAVWEKEGFELQALTRVWMNEYNYVARWTKEGEE